MGVEAGSAESGENEAGVALAGGQAGNGGGVGAANPTGWKGRATVGCGLVAGAEGSTGSSVSPGSSVSMCSTVSLDATD